MPCGRTTTWRGFAECAKRLIGRFSAGTTPSASARLSALAAGCDGTLYAADVLGTQLARITPDGALEEYAKGLFTIDTLATATDCRIWFVGGSNAPAQQVGTFTFTARPGRSR